MRDESASAAKFVDPPVVGAVFLGMMIQMAYLMSFHTIFLVVPAASYSTASVMSVESQ
jgi:hypothetical protein